MIRPVMYHQSRIRAAIEPTRRDKSINQLRFVAAVVDLDVLVRQLADVPPWCLPGRQVPDGFQEPDAHVHRNVQAPAEPLHFRVTNRFTFHFTPIFLPSKRPGAPAGRQGPPYSQPGWGPSDKTPTLITP